MESPCRRAEWGSDCERDALGTGDERVGSGVQAPSAEFEWNNLTRECWGCGGGSVG